MQKMLAFWIAALVILVMPSSARITAGAQAAPVRVANVRSGPWSSAGTWGPAGVPSGGAAVVIVGGTTVEYDVTSDRELASLEIEGALVFSRARSTSLDVGNVLVRAGGALEIGTAQRPIPAGITAQIRLVVPPGARFAGGDFAAGDIGIWVFPGGRWDVYGASLRRTWVKLAQPAAPGDASVIVQDDVSDWPAGGDVVITPSGREPDARDFEERKVGGVRRLGDGRLALVLSSPLNSRHDGGRDMAAEVALLTRNLRIISKYPARVKAHTMYMSGSRGSIAYAEFRDLGALGTFGRYPIHFHRMGDTSRGMVVRGVSVWRSDNHFLNIHGSNGITIADTVGYDTAGMGFFLERADAVHRQPTASPQQKPQEQRQEKRRPGDPSAVDKTARSGEERSPTLEQKRAMRREGRDRSPKGEAEAGNVDTVFLRNLAAKGFWRPGSLDEPRRVALFWVASLNTILIGNVAVGARGGRDAAGFHIAEDSEYAQAAAPMIMFHNESRGNAGHGLFAWTNAKVTFDVVGFKAWRNTVAGIAIGAYVSRFRVIGASLSENGEYGINAWVVRPWIQDSTIERSRIGLFFNRHFVAADPQDPGVVVDTRFQHNSVADISQDHRPCAQAAEERAADSRRCAANYAVLARPQLRSRQPIDFGWHQNASSWLEVLDWAQPAAGLPSSFRIVRRDRGEDAGRPNASVDGRTRPIQRAWDYPPSVALAALPPASAPDTVMRAQVRDDRGVAVVEFFVDGVLLRRVEGPPYEAVWRPGGQAAGAHVFARAIDTAGNVAYSAPVRLHGSPRGTSTPARH
jgi:hypothetical protein